MSTINLIIKPTNQCNLRCKYCYHANTQYTDGLMDLSKLEKLWRMCASEYDVIFVTWHGGEPLLAGRDFYKRALRIQRQITDETKVSFENAMQTNGTLLDRGWIRFLKQNHISAGVSFDGTTNDVLRSHSDVILKNLKRCRKMKYDVGIISVISKLNIDQIVEYEFLKPYVTHAKFNPVFGTETYDENGITAEEYIQSSTALFDHWLQDSADFTLTNFMYYIYAALGVPHRRCLHSSCLGKWLDMDWSGVLRTCGQSGDKQFVIGNIDDFETLDDVFASESFNALLDRVIERRNKCKTHCRFFPLCQGGCPFRASIENGIENPGGFGCATFRGIYSHIEMRIREILSNGTDLNTINPAVKRILLACMATSPLAFNAYVQAGQTVEA